MIIQIYACRPYIFMFLQITHPNAVWNYELLYKKYEYRTETVKNTTDSIFCTSQLHVLATACSHHLAAHRIMTRKFWPYKYSYMCKIYIYIAAEKPCVCYEVS
jgi:hypothetical protein